MTKFVSLDAMFCDVFTCLIVFRTLSYSHLKCLLMLRFLCYSDGREAPAYGTSKWKRRQKAMHRNAQINKCAELNQLSVIPVRYTNTSLDTCSTCTFRNTPEAYLVDHNDK